MMKYLFVSIIIIIVGIVLWFLPTNKNEQFIPVIRPDAPIEKKESGDPNTILIDSGGKKKEMVQIKFSWVIDGLTYNDAIVLTKEQYEKLSPEEIEKMKEDRVNKWVETVNKGSSE